MPDLPIGWLGSREDPDGVVSRRLLIALERYLENEVRHAERQGRGDLERQRQSDNEPLQSWLVEARERERTGTADAR